MAVGEDRLARTTEKTGDGDERSYRHVAITLQRRTLLAVVAAEEGAASTTRR
jgi:hypothetical protein